MSYDPQSRRATGQPAGQPTTYSSGPDVQTRMTTPAKTSAAAVFAVVFGLSALLSVLTVVLVPLGLVLSLIGIVLGIIGIRNADRIQVTGRGTAIGGLVLSIIAALLGGAMALGVTYFLNDERALDRVEQQLQDWRDDLPTEVDLPQ